MKIFMRALCSLVILATGISPFSVHAAPMGFKGSWMSMGDMGPNWRESFVNYAVTPRDAFGVGAIYMRSDDKTRTRDLVEANYTRLLHRWNLPHAQSSLWFASGLGVIKLRDPVTAGNDSRTVVSPGILFDYETTRLYFSTVTRLYRARQLNHDYGSVRAGFSFYETEYDETQPWFIVEARRTRNLSEKTEITPMLRLINKNYFIEAGVNNSRQARFNFMYIF